VKLLKSTISTVLDGPLIERSASVLRGTRPEDVMDEDEII
jgi:hypothetical protein